MGISYCYNGLSRIAKGTTDKAKVFLILTNSRENWRTNSGMRGLKQEKEHLFIDGREDSSRSL